MINCGSQPVHRVNPIFLTALQTKKFSLIPKKTFKKDLPAVSREVPIIHRITMPLSAKNTKSLSYNKSE